jgi:hypothetical protein
LREPCAAYKYCLLTIARSIQSSSETTTHNTNDGRTFAIINYEDDYVQRLILSAIQDLFPSAFTLLPPPETGSLADLSVPDGANILQIVQYEKIDFEYAASHPATTLVNSYMIRKALIRKHFLSSVVDNWSSKHPSSILKSNVKRAEAFEVDYAEFLDDALVEAFDLRASMDRNEALLEGAAEEREWWILKPSMSDRGKGIRLFSSMEELQAIFDRWEEDMPDSDDEDEEEHVGSDADEDDGGAGGKDYITTSHLRHFVAQPYIDPPLLLPEMDNRKFHIRTYVLAVGSLHVYVYKHMLALFAGKSYSPPWAGSGSGSSGDGDGDGEGEGRELDLDAHLTNTCLQGPGARPDSVARFSDLSLPAHVSHKGVIDQINDITGDIFEAAARTMMVHFQPQPNAFEVFGVDFLVDAKGTAWLLEVNAFPDFKQTGDDPRLREVVGGFWKEVLEVAVGSTGWVDGSGRTTRGEAAGDMVLVREVDLGRR